MTQNSKLWSVLINYKVTWPNSHSLQLKDATKHNYDFFRKTLEQLGYVTVSSHLAFIETISAQDRAPQHKHQSIYPFYIQFSQIIMSRVAAVDGEINLALIEICHFLQAVMDAIYHSGHICAWTSLLLTALSWQECPKMSPVVCRVTF